VHGAGPVRSLRPSVWKLLRLQYLKLRAYCWEKEIQMKYGDLSVKTKIICCVLCCIVPISIMTAVFLPKVTAVYDSLRSAADAFDLIQKTVNVEKTVSEIESGMQEYLLSGKESSRQRYNKGKKDLVVLVKDLKASVGADPAGLKQVQQIEGILKKWINDFCEPAISNSPRSETPKGKVGKGPIGSIGDKTNPLYDFKRIVTAFKNTQETRAKQLDKKAASAKRFVYFLSILGIIVILIVSIAVSIYSAHMITKPLNQAIIMTEAVSQGDLSSRVEVTSDDELGRLGRALNVMVKELKDQIGQLFDGVNVLASSGAQISATAAQLAAGASRTSEAVTETTATVEEVKQAAKLSSEKAKDVAQRSQQAAQISESGQTAVEDTVAKMDLIKEQTEAIAETMVKLSEQSEAVGMIIASVQDIADPPKRCARY
jgi:methyl-accepting chemotaxis protein